MLNIPSIPRRMVPICDRCLFSPGKKNNQKMFLNQVTSIDKKDVDDESPPRTHAKKLTQPSLVLPYKLQLKIIY